MVKVLVMNHIKELRWSDRLYLITINRIKKKNLLIEVITLKSIEGLRFFDLSVYYGNEDTNKSRRLILFACETEISWTSMNIR